ncbi:MULTISPECIES: 3-hydroxyanthranilate 3,4-dioxygenase [Prauserella salsuginis group]|uniref:3-hydroxyanthranilate 3,4-dioxygenase n=2 Tax=Prauserella salsuginis group TaxID=2893672 RepID=A0A839XUE3_9PSEU|nr:MULTISPECIES: 3-hydroxyanthranilate 3,4-dioxygenase [Prauserella salsuginis group]MBB3664658.1 3-hydroxyanthranilate 3,4-dioxygenase [Prauserella sediminis]MCR3722125.1 3-hydroxyanthranilate 3,4-dioxygenase [Prauserella flava]MCR3736122.1 3-hydroxyanthranilate 3,4-dioxygenase [Prauserella salsuginis]
MSETLPTAITDPVHFPHWLAENQSLLKPPVANKQLFAESSDFIVMVVGGPNRRTDFHVDPYEEFFYQIKGDMHVDIVTEDGPRTVHIREGEMWLLPGSVPHSPQRPEPGSIGLVFERVRAEGTLEKFQWYCQQCNGLVHEVELQVRNIVADLPPVFEAFYEDAEARTCGDCGALHPGKA